MNIDESMELRNVQSKKRRNEGGLFLTLEGIEGTGKSTHAAFLAERLEDAGCSVVLTREPGGTPAGEAVRNILLHRAESDLGDMAELLLIFAARAQHIRDVIRPALAAGKTVISDRFTDATYAYQGGGRRMDRARIEILERLVQEGLRPDLTILLDVPVETGLARARRRSVEDRFEREDVAFFERVRRAYLDIAAAEPGRMRVLDAARPLEAIQRDLVTLTEEILNPHH